MAEPSQSGHIRIAGAIAGVGSGGCPLRGSLSHRTLIIIPPGRAKQGDSASISLVLFAC